MLWVVILWLIAWYVEDFVDRLEKEAVVREERECSIEKAYRDVQDGEVAFCGEYKLWRKGDVLVVKKVGEVM